MSSGFITKLFKEIELGVFTRTQKTTEWPSPRFAHTFLLGPSNCAYLFGGYLQNSEVSNEMWKLNLETSKWLKINALINPPARHFHTAILIKNYIVIFGGRGANKSQAFNDLWLFDIGNLFNNQPQRE
jgi:hypothetical protein